MFTVGVNSANLSSGNLEGEKCKTKKNVKASNKKYIKTLTSKAKPNIYNIDLHFHLLCSLL